MIRKFYFILAALTAAFSSYIASAQQTAKVTASGIGYLEYLPQGYHSNSGKYPVVIFLHGIIERGTSSTDRQLVLNDLQKVDNVGLPKYVKNGKQYPFIMICPQLKNKYGSWPSSYVIEVLNYVKKHLRIDERRVYLTGLSLGGFGVWRVAGDYPEVFAAIAPICSGASVLGKASAIAAKNVATWGFHGGSDRIVSHTVTTRMVDAINSSPKKPNPLAKATIFPGMGHSIWDKAYNDTQVLQWMLGYRKGSSPAGGHSSEEDSDDDRGENKKSNKPPVVKAGGDKTMTLPSNTLYIEGSATDPDGKIVSYHWTKVSGGTASLKGTDLPKLRAADLKAGTYVFRLTAKDDDGAVKSDDMRVTVRQSGNGNSSSTEKKSSSKNSLPYASAGPDREITLPTNAITIQGRATDRDGKIVAYDWVKTYGHSVTLSGDHTSRVHISNLRSGVYIFRLRVRDDDGGITDDYFKITVHRGKSNVAPSAYAGPDLVITSPASSVRIRGKASDTDGRIVSYEWVKTYGNRATLSGSRSSEVNISNLSPGVYIFRFSVRDNDGAVKHDYFKITVKSSNT